MKKNLLVTMLVGVALTVVAATGCGAFAPDAETGTNTEESEAVVKPLYPLETAQDALADGGYSVSFTADDLMKTDAGYELTVEVYEYDRYEMEAIDNLESGSKILQIPLHRITDSASNGSVFPVVTEHFSASSDHAFL